MAIIIFILILLIAYIFTGTSGKPRNISNVCIRSIPAPNIPTVESIESVESAEPVESIQKSPKKKSVSFNPIRIERLFDKDTRYIYSKDTIINTDTGKILEIRDNCV